MLSGNPITIEKSAIDLMGLMTSFSKTTQANAIQHSIVDGKVNIDSMIKYLSEQKENLENFSLNNSINEDYVAFVKDMPSDYYLQGQHLHKSTSCSKMQQLTAYIHLLAYCVNLRHNL